MIGRISITLADFTVTKARTERKQNTDPSRVDVRSDQTGVGVDIRKANVRQRQAGR